MTTLSLFVKDGETDTKFKFESTIEDTGVYESRAKDLANILSYDKEHYNDLNIETVIRAANLAGIIIPIE